MELEFLIIFGVGVGDKLNFQKYILEKESQKTSLLKDFFLLMEAEGPPKTQLYLKSLPRYMIYFHDILIFLTLLLDSLLIQ